MSLPDLTKTGTTYRERYIIPTVTVPPTGTVEQRGVAAREVTPGPSNRSQDARLLVSGALRDVANNEPTIVVRVAGATQAQVGGPAVSALTIQRTNSGMGLVDGSAAKLTRDFAFVQDFDIKPPGSGSDWRMRNEPAVLIEDAFDGSFKAVMAVQLAGGSTTLQTHAIVVYSFNPAVDTTWQLFTYGYLHTITGLSGSSYFTSNCFTAAQHPNGTIYIVIGGYAGASDSSVIYVITLNGTTSATATFSYVGGTGTLTTGLLNGGALTFLPGSGGGVAALGIADLNELDQIIHRRITLFRSADMRTWDVLGTDSVLPEIGSTRMAPIATASATRLEFTDHCWGNADHGWAVTNDGRIFSLNANRTIVPCSVPQPDIRYASVKFYTVAAASNSDGAFTVYAAGECTNPDGFPSGIIYKSIDSGVSWAVVPTWPNVQWFEEEDLTAPYDGTLPFTERWILPVRAIALTSDTKGWFVGDRGFVGYTSDGQATRVFVRSLISGAGRLNAVIADTLDNILVAGEAQDSSELSTTANRLCRAVLIANATTSMTVNDAANTYLCPQIANDDAPIMALTNAVANTTALTNSASIIYAVTQLGAVWRRKYVTSAFVWTSIATLPPGPVYTDIGAVVGTPDSLMVTATGTYMDRHGIRKGRNGTLWESLTANQATPTFTPVVTVQNPLTSIIVTTLSNATIIGGRTLYGVVSQSMDFCYPAILVCPDGSILLARANMTLGAVEVFRAPTNALDFTLVDRSIFFTPSAVDTISAAVLRSSLCVAHNGDILLMAGSEGRVSPDNGRTWMNRTDARLPLPLGTITADADYTQIAINHQAKIAAIGAGPRLWTTVPKTADNYVGLFVARNWSTSGTDYLPALQSPQWLGIDGLYFVLVGFPPVGDLWSVGPHYEFGVANFTLYESPSITWRSRSDQAELVIRWDRQAAAITDVLGTGLFWDVCGWAIFGANVRQVYFELSDPSTDAFTTSYFSQLSADAGTCANVGGRVSDVLTCYSAYPGTLKAWIPGQYTAGMRQYFVEVAGATNIGGTTTGGSTTLVVTGVDLSGKLTPGDEIALASAATTYARVVTIAYAGGDTTITTDTALAGTGQQINKRARVLRVLSNTANQLKVDGLVAIATTTTYIIYGDRHAYCDTTSRDGSTRFGRYVQIKIPAQPTPDGYAEIGTPVLGIEPPPDTEGRSFAYGMNWAPVVNTTQQLALSGIRSVEHHGRLGQIWGLSYRAEHRDAVLRKLQPFGNRLLMAFALLFDGTSEGAELVSLIDAQQYKNLLGDRFDSTWALKEVV